MNKFDQIENELYYLRSSDPVHRDKDRYVSNIRTILCQVRETLEALEAKQKIWEAKVANQEAQPEPEHSTPLNDQISPEKEQSQRTAKTRNKQYIISYPEGTHLEVPNSAIAEMVVDRLRSGKDVIVPNTWKIQVIDL